LPCRNRSRSGAESDAAVARDHVSTEPVRISTDNGREEATDERDEAPECGDVHAVKSMARLTVETALNIAGRAAVRTSPCKDLTVIARCGLEQGAELLNRIIT
jgi:hypothetical protein